MLEHPKCWKGFTYLTPDLQAIVAVRRRQKNFMMQQLKSAEEIPGSYGLPLLGETPELFRTEGVGFFWGRFQHYGPVFKSYVVGRKCAVLVGPDANQFLMQEKADHLSAYLGWRDFVEPMLGRPIFLQDGQEHRRRRRIMAPAFHGRAIANYFDTMQTIIQDFLKNWVEQGTIPLIDEFRKLTLLVAIRLLLGVERENEVKQISQWFRQIDKGFLALLRVDIPLTVYGRARNASRQLRALLRTIIAERKRQGDLQEYRDALGVLLAGVDENGETLSESQVIDEALSLLNGGYLTIPSLLSSLLFELGAHPEWRERLRQEQKPFLGNDLLMVEDLKQFTQMVYVLKEVERLYPPSPFLFRGVVKDIEYAGYHIPAGWYVVISPMLTHRMSEIYAAPTRFDPERFAPPREEDKQHPFALIGFGGGIHSCIGFEFAQMQMKIVLSSILRNYDWTITPDPSVIAPIRKLEMPENKKFTEIQDSLRAHFVPLVRD